jgi:hypothetical protein
MDPVIQVALACGIGIGACIGLWLDGVLYDDNSFLVKFLDKFDKEE